MDLLYLGIALLYFAGLALLAARGLDSLEGG